MSTHLEEHGEEWDRLTVALAGTRFTDVRRVAETGSTNADLLELARHGAPEGIVLVADHQQAGRGRLGRVWQAPPGSSLLVSILVRPALRVDESHLVTTALGVAASETVAEAGVRAGLKWPNDLVVADPVAPAGQPGRKLSGMLTEAVVDDDQVTALVLGIGINVNWPSPLPDELADIAVAMNHVLGRPVSRPAVLASLLARFDHWYGALASTDGRSQLLGAYRARSATIGRRVQVDLGSERVVGDAIDVSAEGHLLVVDECPDRPREIVAGDVVHLRPAD